MYIYKNVLTTKASLGSDAKKRPVVNLHHFLAQIQLLPSSMRRILRLVSSQNEM